VSVYVTAVAVCVLLALALLFLLRTRRIREKYAAIWILLTVSVIVLAVFPQLAFWVSDLVGVQTPVNLVFALAIVVLLAVCIQLSTEVSNLEEETRTLAEEIALLRLDVRELAERADRADRAAGIEPDGAGHRQPPPLDVTREGSA
jgi:hypothetical protein